MVHFFFLFRVFIYIKMLYILVFYIIIKTFTSMFCTFYAPSYGKILRTPTILVLISWVEAESRLSSELRPNTQYPIQNRLHYHFLLRISEFDLEFWSEWNFEAVPVLRSCDIFCLKTSKEVDFRRFRVDIELHSSLFSNDAMLSKTIR